MSEPIRDLTYDELSALERLRASEQNRLEATVETWRARERQLLDALRLSEARVAELETTIRVNDDDFERQKAFLQEALEDEHAQLAVAVARCDELREATEMLMGHAKAFLEPFGEYANPAMTRAREALASLETGRR